MRMVGESHGRIARGPRSYPGATRFMYVPKVKEPFSWRRVWDYFVGIVYFIVLLYALRVIAFALTI